MTSVSIPPEIKSAPMDDVMLAMDVVDTLRHSSRLIEKELDAAGQDQRLLKRLRDIYSNQGIDVPDYILKEGVQALREDRFRYEPTPSDFKRKLAEIYVSRAKWGRLVLAICGALAISLLSYYALWVYPKYAQQNAVQIELSQTLPSYFESAFKRVEIIANDQSIIEQAEEIKDRGLKATLYKDVTLARAQQEKMRQILNTLEQAYVLKVVGNPNESSGVWRVPDNNSDARNYYLIVQPFDKNGNVIPLTIINEESNKSVETKKFGVRVSESVFESIRRDKQDDGIIQNNIVATKARGDLEPVYSISVLNGRITEW